MRSDKAKNIAKVVVARASKPLASQREIARDIWLDDKTVSNLEKELPQISAKSDHIETIIQKDLQVVNKAQEILLDRLNTNPDDISTRDIISSADVSAKRYSLFKWDVTDKDWWLKNISELDLLD